MANEPDGCASIFGLIILLAIGAAVYWFLRQDIHIVELRCESSLDYLKDCQQVAAVEAEVEIIANPYISTVSFRIINDPTHKYHHPSFFFLIVR